MVQMIVALLLLMVVVVVDMVAVVGVALAGAPLAAVQR